MCEKEKIGRNTGKTQISAVFVGGGGAELITIITNASRVTFLVFWSVAEQVSGVVCQLRSRERPFRSVNYVVGSRARLFARRGTLREEETSGGRIPHVVRPVLRIEVVFITVCEEREYIYIYIYIGKNDCHGTCTCRHLHTYIYTSDVYGIR